MKHPWLTGPPLIRTMALAAMGLMGGAALLYSTTAWAQDSGAPEGPVLRIGVSERLSWSDNPSLSANPTGGRVVSNTRLSFALTDQTALNTFKLAGNTGLRLSDSAASGFGSSVADPRFSLAYSRLGATSQLDLTAAFQRNDIAFLRPLSDFTDDDGTIDLPTDLDDLQGSGIRQSLKFGAKLTLRDDAPFGLTLSAGVTDLRYQDVTDPDLNDTTRSFLRATARLDINDVTQARVGLSYRSFLGSNNRNDSLGLNTGLTITRPDGELRVSFSADDSDRGTRLRFEAGRSFDLPTGNLSFDLGLSQSTAGRLKLTGDVSYSHDFDEGQVNASLRQTITEGSDDSDRLQTSLSAGLSRPLSPLASLNLGLGYVISENLGSGSSTQSADFSASLGYALSPDWDLNVGYSFQSRDSDAAEAAHSNSVFVGISRSFEIPL